MNKAEAKKAIQKERDTGGYAFPIPEQHCNEGMTLRDYFAGQVITSETGEVKPKDAAEWAYRVADAMLKERSST